MSSFDAYKKLLNSQPEGERTFEVVVVSHSKFSKTYYFVLDNQPLTASLPDTTVVTFEPASIKTSGAQSSNDLDQLFSFTAADVDNLLDDELDRIPLGDEEDIIVQSGIYHSDYLDEPAQWFTYEVKKIPQQKGVFTAQCGVPDLNADQTGEVFDFDTYPMLRSL